MCPTQISGNEGRCGRVRKKRIKKENRIKGEKGLTPRVTSKKQNWGRWERKKRRKSLTKISRGKEVRRRSPSSNANREKSDSKSKKTERKKNFPPRNPPKAHIIKRMRKAALLEKNKELWGERQAGKGGGDYHGRPSMSWVTKGREGAANENIGLGEKHGSRVMKEEEVVFAQYLKLSHAGRGQGKKNFEREATDKKTPPKPPGRALRSPSGGQERPRRKKNIGHIRKISRGDRAKAH